METQQVLPEVKDVLSPSQAAKFLGVSRMTLWRWVKKGKITPVIPNHAYIHINELNRVKSLRKEQRASE